MFMTVLGVAIYIAKFAGRMAALALVGFAAVGADDFNLVFTVACGSLRTQSKGALPRTKMARLLLAVWQALFISSSFYRFLATANITGDRHVTTSIAPFFLSFGKGIATNCTSFPARHLTPPACLAPGVV